MYPRRYEIQMFSLETCFSAEKNWAMVIEIFLSDGKICYSIWFFCFIWYSFGLRHSLDKDAFCSREIRNVNVNSIIFDILRLIE